MATTLWVPGTAGVRSSIWEPGGGPTPITTVYFLDTFTGTGALIDHTPDVAPDGFVYVNNGSGPDSTLELTGTGNVQCAPIGYGTSATVQAIYSPAMEFTYPYSITLIGRPTDDLGLSISNLYLQAPDFSFVIMSIGQNGIGADPPWYVEVEVQSQAGGYRYFYLPQATAAEHTLVLTITSEEATLTIDGSDKAVDSSFEGPMFNSIETFYVLVDGDDPVPHGYISEIRIESTS